jgi:ubiquinone/menaquinone biosynthesis C-methylase UbiE
MWKDWVQAILPYIGTSEKVLELGFGPGHLQAALRSSGYDSVGIDASRSMARQAFYLSRKSALNFVLVNGYAQFMPFSKRVFSHVLATFPSEYIFEPLTLAEIWRVLPPDGQLLILPIAWITDERWPYRLASGLFRFTGQAPPYRVEQASQYYIAPIKKAGFKVTIQEIKRPSSSLLLIKANKIS